MSVSLALLPVALAMRAVMGQKRFDSWVDSVQIKIPTSISDSNELLRTVKGAGYDCDPFFGGFKTHVRTNGLDWFTWDVLDGKWTAIFSRYNNRDSIVAFMREFEKQQEHNTRIFERNEETQRIEAIRTKTFPTDFANAQLLTQTLEQHGAQVTQSGNGDLKAFFGSHTRLIFRSTGDGPYIVEVPPAVQEQLAYNLMGHLDDTYREQIQQQTYQTLQKRIESSHFTIESEEVLQDKTIVITLNVSR